MICPQLPLKLSIKFPAVALLDNSEKIDPEVAEEFEPAAEERGPSTIGTHSQMLYDCPGVSR
jgi:hypothetical protein